VYRTVLLHSSPNRRFAPPVTLRHTCTRCRQQDPATPATRCSQSGSRLSACCQQSALHCTAPTQCFCGIYCSLSKPVLLRSAVAAVSACPSLHQLLSLPVHRYINSCLCLSIATSTAVSAPSAHTTAQLSPEAALAVRGA
jgi:hypothetical protein